MKNPTGPGDRPVSRIHKSIENSLCFSLLDEGKFIGFCRVITDYTTFSYLCDLFILTEYQNRRYGSSFLKAIISDEELKGTKFVLFTKTAHRFYRKFGFHQDEEWLEKVMFK